MDMVGDGGTPPAPQCTSLPVTIISPPGVHRNLDQYQDVVSQVASTFKVSHPMMAQARPIYSQAVIRGWLTGAWPKSGVTESHLSGPDGGLSS